MTSEQRWQRNDTSSMDTCRKSVAGRASAKALRQEVSAKSEEQWGGQWSPGLGAGAGVSGERQGQICVEYRLERVEAGTRPVSQSG